MSGIEVYDALTVNQPYAWMLVWGSKDLENRGWKPNAIVKRLIAERRPFVVHAATRMTRRYYDEAVAFAAQEDPAMAVPARGDLVLGALVGLVTPMAIVAPSDYAPPGDPKHRRFHMPNQYGWELSERRPFAEPKRMNGTQGFWKVFAKDLPALSESVSQAAFERTIRRGEPMAAE